MQLGVNYNTINKVYQDLERDGFIFTRRGKGSYVAERTAYEALDIDDEVEALATDLVGRAFEKGMEADDLVDLVREKIVQLTGRAR